MKRSRTFGDRVVPADPDDLVSFSVVYQGKPGTTLDDVRSRLSLRTLDEFWPPDGVGVRAQVVDQLRSLGFEVFKGSSPVVSARGSVRLFESVFGGKLIKQTRRRTTGISGRTRTVTSIVLSTEFGPPSPDRIAGALHVAVAAVEPIPTTPSLPPVTRGFNLHLPGDIAQLTGASATHRLSTPLGERATGGGVGVAVIDQGIAEHPYYSGHGYRITRVAAADVTSNPAHDDDAHGTCILSGLLACAPDVQVFGIKYGDPVVALEGAIDTPGVKVISLSWGYDLSGKKTLATAEFDHLPLQLVILDIIQKGVTVVAAAGNVGAINFPAMMPEVIAVGGVEVDAADSLSAYSGGSSFVSAIFKGRAVPDVCGIASAALLPIPGTTPDPGPPKVSASPPGWDSLPGGTSLATCQVAGVAALLLQKSPTLTPLAVRAALMSTATDVVSGKTASGNRAKKGPDLATGFGLVDALKAWNSV